MGRFVCVCNGCVSIDYLSEVGVSEFKVSVNM